MLNRVVLILCAVPLLAAPVDDIRAVLARQQTAWNQGDLMTFVADYHDAPDTTFIGSELTSGGRRVILECYQRRYPNREAMGTLAFSGIDVRVLSRDFAIAAGQYKLERTQAGGGNATGRFSLVLRRTKAGWKIIHDHSS